MYSILGFLCILGALAAPFLFYSIVRKAVDSEVPYIECGVLAFFGVAFVLWLVSVFGSLPTA